MTQVKITRSDGTEAWVDPADVWGPPLTAAQIETQRFHEAKVECRKRILAVVDETAQINLAAAAAGNMLTAAQMTVYQSGLMWIHQMRANCVTLSQNTDIITADASWPAVPENVPELAAAF